jgi:hypothetical protein
MDCPTVGQTFAAHHLPHRKPAIPSLGAPSEAKHPRSLNLHHYKGVVRHVIAQPVLSGYCPPEASLIQRVKPLPLRWQVRRLWANPDR